MTDSWLGNNHGEYPREASKEESPVADEMSVL